MSRTIYVKITNPDFSMASMWPVDYVGPFNEVVAKWITDHEYGIITDSDGTPASAENLVEVVAVAAAAPQARSAPKKSTAKKKKAAAKKAE